MRERHKLADGGGADFVLAEDARLAALACDWLIRVLTAQLSSTAQHSPDSTAQQKSSTARHGTAALLNSQEKRG
jgi:hypothetical protein